MWTSEDLSSASINWWESHKKISLIQNSIHLFFLQHEALGLSNLGVRHAVHPQEALTLGYRKKASSCKCGWKLVHISHMNPHQLTAPFSVSLVNGHEGSEYSLE